jgi:hypothetical protein
VALSAETDAGAATLSPEQPAKTRTITATKMKIGLVAKRNIGRRDGQTATKKFVITSITSIGVNHTNISSQMIYRTLRIINKNN